MSFSANLCLKMVVKTRWRLCSLTVILLLNLELVITSKEILKNLTVGFSNALEVCRTEVST